MTKPLATLSPRSIRPARTAIFLDFDGTLVELAEHPDKVDLTAATKTALTRIHRAFGGALAVVTGRDIGDVDKFLEPLHVPVAGIHGLKRRNADGAVRGPSIEGRTVSEVGERLASFVNGSQGVFIERKGASVALHYRARPDLEGECLAAMDDAVRGIDGVHLLRGKMVIEAKAGASDKGAAVSEFLSEPPFAGRTPLFAGDDVTDEDAFAVVNARQGISVKVGPGKTAARFRADTVAAFLDWLRCIAEHFDGRRSRERT